VSEVFNKATEKAEEGLAGLGERLYSEYEKLPWYKQLLLAIAPVTGETISAYETPIFAEKTKEAYKKGDFLETAGHGALTGLSVLGAIPFLGAGIRGVKAGVKGARKGLASLSEPLNFPAKPSKWWLDPDKDVVTLYHGTNIKNLQEISEKGLRSDRQGFTYLTPDPDTGVGYAVMDQGEKVFRRQGKPKQVPIEERALLEIEVPQKEIISDIQRSPTSKEKLFSGRELFDESERITFRGQEGIPIDARYRSPYYDLTEVRLQQDIPVEWIKGYSIKDNLLK